MKENTKQVLDWLGLSEGGYVDHPDDPGGATNRGVTQYTYNAWRRTQGLEWQSVRFITQQQADDIFVEQYFAPVWFDKLPAGLDYAMADYSVNSGPSRAIKDLQRVLNDLDHGLSVDGAMGYNTYNAVLQEDPGLLVSALCNRRMAFLKRLKHWRSFGKGWTRRVMGETDGAQDSDTGVIDRGIRMAKGAKPQGLSKPKAHIRAKAPDAAENISLWAAIAQILAAIFGRSK